LLGHWIEAVGIKHRSLIVIAKNRDLATIDNRIETFTRVGSIPNDIAKAKHILDILLPDVIQHSTQCLDIPVNVAD
jgi:hypothetical protein